MLKPYFFFVGFFVSLNDIYVEGLVHISELRNDYYHYDAVNHQLKAEHGERAYRLSDEIEVIVARVDLDERKIEFEYVKQMANFFQVWIKEKFSKDFALFPLSIYSDY